METAEAAELLHRFEAMSESNRPALQKALYLVVQQGQAVGVLPCAPTIAVFEDFVEMLLDRYGDHQLTQKPAELPLAANSPLPSGRCPPASPRVAQTLHLEESNTFVHRRSEMKHQLIVDYAWAFNQALKLVLRRGNHTSSKTTKSKG
jgi:hypothetical protein